MSPLAKLLQIKSASEFKREDRQSMLGKIWTRFLNILRSAKVQRRVRRIEVVERVALGNKQSVVLLRLDQREFMVGCCGDSVVLLAPPAAAIAAEAIKAPIKRQPRVKAAKPRVISQPMLAAIEAVASNDSQIKVRQSAKKTTPNIELPLQHRVPTKARLIKAFAGRAQ